MPAQSPDQRDYITAARDLRDHPEAITTAKDATEIAIGVLAVLDSYIATGIISNETVASPDCKVTYSTQPYWVTP